jgi:1-acyl-sn-glycerol-3-phosphate acyltransferase
VLYYFLKFWAQILFAVFFKLRVIGRENVPLTGGALLATNHQSYIDPPIVGVGLTRKIHFMARKSLFDRFAPFGWLISRLNAFPVERDRGDVGAVREALRRLNSGAAIVVFPEGTRTLNGDIGSLKPGIFVIAGRAGVPIVPTVIDGAFESWPRWRKTPRPYPIIVAFGEPIVPERFDNDADAMAAACRERMLTLQSKIRESRKGIRGAVAASEGVAK